MIVSSTIQGRSHPTQKVLERGFAREALINALRPDDNAIRSHLDCLRGMFGIADAEAEDDPCGDAFGAKLPDARRAACVQSFSRAGLARRRLQHDVSFGGARPFGIAGSPAGK
jgi:hypothetical protein